MPVPTDYIFTSAGTCMKNQVYQLIIDQLISAGWTNISSNSSTDYAVLQSAGNTGDKNLLLNLRPTNTSGVNSVVSTDYNAMSFRLQDTYTPGTSGASGTFGRPSLAWSNFYIAPTTTLIAGNTPINYKCYVDASKIILGIEYPSSTGYGPLVFYLGRPDTVYVAESASRGVLVCASAGATGSGSAQICNTSDDSAAVTASYSINTAAFLPFSKNPNGAGKYYTSKICYGSATESLRGELDGLLCAYNSGLSTGDTIIINSCTYYVLVCASMSNTSFPSPALLLRIA